MLSIRRPGREGQRIDCHRFYLCDTGRPQHRVGRVDQRTCSPGSRARRDVPAPARSRPRCLVRTHAKRDQCCAVRGRPVAAALDDQVGRRLLELDPDAAVWECSHTGGHRFAPVLLLPGTGYTYGPAETDLAVRIVEAELEGRVVTERLRGRSTWPPAGQVAEVVVRESGVAAGIDDLGRRRPGRLPRRRRPTH